jgi:tRNA(Ile)-lysidine synthase
MSESLLDQNHQMDDVLRDLSQAPHWYVGFSGGVDSTVLLHLLHRWCSENPGAPPLSVIHINHGMQSAADEWQHHCERLCTSLALPFVSYTVEVPPAGSREAAARDARYQVFEGQLQRADVLFLGHHLDDQVETFFLRLMRGAGVAGLAAIPRRRSLGKGLLARLLLDVSRSEIEEYARRHSLAYVVDPSNADTHMDRNFLRAQVLPLLASHWPSYQHTVTRAAAHMADAAVLLDNAYSAPPIVRYVMGDAGLAVTDLMPVSGDTASVTLRAWLRALGQQAPDQVALQEFLRQLSTAAVAGRPTLTCSAYSLQRYREVVYLLPEVVKVAVAPTSSLTAGASLEIAGVGRVSLVRASGEGLMLAPGERLQLRWREGGERCHLPGRAGSASLKKLLQEWGVPPWWRDRVPLLYLDDEILAIGDLAQCASPRWRTSAAKGERLWCLRWERPESTTCD